MREKKVQQNWATKFRGMGNVSDQHTNIIKPEQVEFCV